MKYSILFTLCFLFVCTTIGFAQKKGTVISGTVIDKQLKQPVEFATVTVLATNDSSINYTVLSDKNGKFSVHVTAPGNYILHCSFIGYVTTTKQIAVLSQQKINTGVIDIVSLTVHLNEVVVTAEKSLLTSSIDRKVYNVSQDLLAQSGTASDLLKNIPSVEVDIDGNVSLRGSTEVMILINGRPSPLMGKTRADVLQQFPANSIERIEVITNPSARFKPDGTSGIINIVLKKNAKQGWNGTVSLNAGNKSRYNGSASLNYNPGKLNLFSLYSLRQDSRIRINEITREYKDSAGAVSGYYTEHNQSNARPISHFATIGADYSFNKANSIGLSGNLLIRNQIKHDLVKKNLFDKNNQLTEKYNRLRFDLEVEKEKDATAYWQHHFKKEDHELRAEFNSSASDEVENNHYSNIYVLPTIPASLDNTVIRQSDHQQQLTVDYSNPLSESSKIEAGYAGSFTQLDMNFFGEYYDAAQAVFVKDVVKSNHFRYNESIHAFYGTYEKRVKKFGYLTGLRAEEAEINSKLITMDSVINNSYFKIYPTVHLSYQLKRGELQLNYSKRVHRPEGDDLNPFPEYRDPRNLQAGNPKLLPEIIHSVETGYKWQNKVFSFLPTLYYRYKMNGFTTITIPLNDSTLLTTEQNLSNDQSAGLELIFSAKAGKVFTANLNSNLFYNTIDATSLGYTNRRSILSFSTNFISTINFTKSTRLQLSCNYRSARLTPQGKQFPSFVVNAGIREDLLNHKLSVILTASDLFKTLQQKTVLNTPYLKQVSIGRRDAQIFYLGISFRFCKTNKKQSEEKMQFDNNL